MRRRSSAGSPSASRSASPTNGKLITSTQPAPASVRPTRRRSRCSRVSPRPAGARRQHRRHLVVADDPDDLLDQVVGVGEVRAPRRRGHGQPVAVLDDVAADGRAGWRRSSAASISMPVIRAGRSTAIVIARARRRRADDGHAGLDRAAAVRRRAARRPGRRRAGAIVGSTPRSMRLPASEGSLCRLPVRNIETGVPVRGLDEHAGGRRRTSRWSRRPSRRRGRSIPESSVTTRSSVESARSTPSRVVSRSPSARPADHDRARQLVARRSRGSAGRARASRSW